VTNTRKTEVRQMAVKLFVGGLSFSTSSDRLREVFAAIGNVESARVVTDRDTGRSRGFGFVEMASDQDAQQAVSRLNGQDVDGRQIKVEVAKPSERGGSDRGGSRGGGRGGRW
jgi:RNA recognition motif-containing protein